jgi:hypothetical protein
MSELRNATLADLATLLKDQQTRKVDVIAPASKIRALEGKIVVQDYVTRMDESGVTSLPGLLTPTAVFDEGVSDKLGIPLGYVRRLRNERLDLWDDNVNGWLYHDQRSFLVRSFASEESGQGIARAFLSDSYKTIDHLDALTAVLEGVRKAGAEVEITQCDLTERKMYVKVAAPQVRAYAGALLDGYRPVLPATGPHAADDKTVFAGFVIKNSEVGDGAFSITPSMTVQVCTNGLTITRDAVRAVHLGGKLDEGVIRWSEETQEKTLELITLKAADAVRTFLDVDYMTRQIAWLNEKAGTPISGPLDETVRSVGKKLAFGEAVTDGVLDHFLRGGQFTAGGVLNAVTSFSQTLKDADAAWALEEQGIRAMEVAAAL